MKAFDLLLKGHTLKQITTKFEKDLVLKVLERFNWNTEKSAIACGITRQGMLQKIKALNLPNPNRRRSLKSLEDSSN